MISANVCSLERISKLRLPSSLDEDRLHVYPGCSCRDGCSTDCACFRASCAEMTFECGLNCQCDKMTCIRRTCQQASPFGNAFKIFNAGSKGAGLTASVPIRKNDFVLLYLGEIISAQESARRKAAHEQRGERTYIFELHENISARECILKTCVDATHYGNEARFINHSCDPNLRVQVVRWHYIPHISLFAARDISAGEELTFDYGFTTSTPENDSILLSQTPCECGSPRCRGFLPHHTGLM
eukprot:gene9259-1537_t